MNYVKILIFALAVTAIGLFLYLDLQNFLTLEALRANRQALFLFYKTHTVLVAGFMVIYVLQTALSLSGAAILSLAAGLTRLPIRTFVLGTSIGIIPGGFVYVNASTSLATITSLSGIVSPRVLGSFALLGFSALLPVFYSKIKSYRRK